MYDPNSKTSSSNSYTHRNPSYTSNAEEHEIGYRNRYGEVQFAPINYQEGMEADDSGAISPPLWRSSPSPSRPLLTRRGSFSPDSRAQAIARGRSELMEMVRHMPEASYELSLKDIVEHHHRAENQPAKTGGESLRDEGGSDRKLKKEESRKFERKLSFEEKGLFLNMAFPFPFPFRSNKKKKKIVGGNSGRVSPKPEGLKGGGERDWWKRKFTGSSDSDSSRISNNSGGSSSTAATATSSSSGGRSDAGERRKNAFTTGCWQFFQLRRSKSA